MPADLCCVHVNPSRSISPTEPARPSALTLDGIFAVAALPKDHPHSLKIPDRSPPKLTKSLIRSPSFANKLRGQLRRRATIRSLKAEVYDEDARQMTSEEVLASVIAAAAPGGRKTKWTGSPPTLKLRKSSPLYSSPELGRSSAFELPTSARRVQSTNALKAARDERQLSESYDDELRDLAYLNLDLASHQLDGQSNVPEASPTAADVLDDAGENLAEHNVDEDQPTSERAHKLAEAMPASSTNAENVTDSTGTANIFEEVESAGGNERSDSHSSFHLSKSHISQQLRSVSQLSGPSEDSNRLTPEAWTFHRRERSGCFPSTVNGESSRSRHLQQTSVDSTHVPESWGRVTKEPDASSSIYSRPTSPDVPEPYEIPADLAAIADWPLKSETNLAADVLSQHDAAAKTSQYMGEDDIHITIIEPDQPRTTTDGETESIAELPGSSCSITVDRAPSHKSSSSSTTKHSRFLERFTPPKKTVRKRRSIFKFLRAGSRRNQTRSISTPVLCSPHLRPLVDGAVDDNELVTVQYELTAPETNAVRSVSLNNLPATALSESHDVASSPDLRRKPSLAEYERHLSVTGDNRRRPSARDLNRLSQINEDDKHEPLPTKTSFSYYSQTQDTDPLMEAALERQLREKALFRSPSKHSVPISESSSMSFLAPSWDEPSSAQPQSPDRDPLDSGNKRPSASHLSPPRTPIGGRSRTSSLSNHKQTNSKKPIVLHTPSSVSKSSITSRIGSSLDSWSRFPSHTRGTQCASAGTADGVRTFDFALDIKHERIRGTDESDPSIPGKRVRTDTPSAKSTKKPLPKSRSATFGSFYRYYSNLFSSPPEFHGRGRRTSVATGGRLAHPELEILGPVLPVTGSPHSIMHIHELDDLRPGRCANIKEHNTKLDKHDGITSDDHLLHDPTRKAPVLTPFRGDSVFKPHTSDQGTLNEIEIIAASDAEAQAPDDYFSPQSHSNVSTSAIDLADRNPALDGTVDPTDPVKRPAPSKAQTWSDAYQDCLGVPPSPAHHLSSTTKADADAAAMPPPSLRPTKTRSPRETPAAPQNSCLDPSAAIRRFPSVTVVDDRKGHWRSVSFISVKSSKSGASAASFVRESSNDLLKLMEVREREEREKLLQPVL